MEISSQTTTYGGIAQTLISVLEKQGVNVETQLKNIEVSEADIRGKDGRVQSRVLQKIWRMAVDKTGNDAFGIDFALSFPPTALHGLGFAWLASDTLKEALYRLVRYYRLIATAGDIVLNDNPDSFSLWYKVPGPKGAAAPASLDAALALFVQMCRITKGDDFRPAKVEMQRKRPSNIEKFTAFFKCEILFDCNENQLHFDRETLEMPLPGSNPALARVNDQIVMDYLREHDKSDIVAQIRTYIIETLPSGAPSQKAIATQLHMSQRNMQRKLNQHSTSFKKLVDDARKELAEAYLKEGTKSIGEVTYLLGFSEPSNFTRSFKKWTGTTPADFQLRYKA